MGHFQKLFFLLVQQLFYGTFFTLERDREKGDRNREEEGERKWERERRSTEAKAASIISEPLKSQL